MATIFNAGAVAGEPVGKATTRQHLLTEARVPGTGARSSPRTSITVAISF